MHFQNLDIAGQPHAHMGSLEFAKMLVTDARQAVAHFRGDLPAHRDGQAEESAGQGRFRGIRHASAFDASHPPPARMFSTSKT